MNPFHKNKRKKNNLKINLMLAGFFLLFFILIARLFILQIIDSEKYKIAAKKQYQRKEIIYPSRGLIFDRNMNLLVSNTTRYMLAADPNMLKNPDSVAYVLSLIFGKDKNEYLSKLINKNTSYVPLEKKVDPLQIKGYNLDNIAGIILKKEDSRIYNYGSLASQILGFTNSENKGAMGIENSFDKELSGKEGYMLMHMDGKGNKRPDTQFPQKNPENGGNIVLTIDINVQKFVEEELEKSVNEYKALNGKVVVMSVKTGEILSLAGYPTFNPNEIKPEDTSGMKNSVISDMFEPGSTFKIVTASAVIEENLQSINSMINVGDESFDYHGITDVHEVGSMTFQHAIEISSNKAFVQISEILGKERLYKYARDFGFGISTGIELPNENKGILKKPVDFSDETLGFMTIGYQVMINTLQLSSAYSSVANNGILMKPYVVKKIISLGGAPVMDYSPIQVRKVISEKTANLLAFLLKGVIESGTAKSAKIEGISIAGKTGTAQKYLNDGYSKNNHIASFVGFFPAENPLILITVIIDDPQTKGYTGGDIAAPVFRNIASRIITSTDLLKENNNELLYVNNNTKTTENINAVRKSYSVPNLIDLKVDDACEILKEKKIKYEIIYEDGNDEKSKNGNLFIVSQVPSPNETMDSPENIKLKLFVKNLKVSDNILVKIPDVMNFSLRRAINKLVTEGFSIEINGSGKVVGQYPKPGENSLPKSKIILYCKENTN
jgi:cell division protein FtsI/penicillin-binding protein 2